MSLTYNSRWQAVTEPSYTVVIGMCYNYDGVDKYFVVWSDGSSRLLREDVIRLCFKEIK